MLYHNHHSERELSSEKFPKANRDFGTAKLRLIYELNRQFSGEKSHLVPLMCATWNQIIEELRLFGQLQQGLGLASG
jgi:hypothetical protein